VRSQTFTGFLENSAKGLNASCVIMTVLEQEYCCAPYLWNL
jgi:hypothetical protein